MRPTRIILALLAFAVITVAEQNCSDVALVKVQSSQSSVSSNMFGPLRPVLAIRKTACIMCHAQINGDVVTDFGYGDPFFMGTDAPANHPNQPDYSPFTSKHFLASGQTWASASIMGNVYVPNGSITNEALIQAYSNSVAGNPAVAGTLKILDFVSGKFVDPTISVSVPVQLIGTTASTDIGTPGLRGKFVARQSILIDSPTATEIQNLEGGVGAQQVLTRPGVVIYKGSANDSIAGFSVVQSQNTSKLILTNAGNVTCKGDIIIEGTLFLNQLNLDTDGNGCRLYVTGSVFIQGAVTYVNGGNSNLQITSSRAIIMGMRDLSSRLTQQGALPAISGIRQANTEELELALYQNIFTDRDSVDDLINDAGPFQIMVDSTQSTVLAVQSSFETDTWVPGPGQTTFPDPTSCVIGIPTTGATCAINWTSAYAIGMPLRKSISFTHMLLNAPTVQNRYLGTFQGVVIAEDALFAVNGFSFEQDPLMFTVPLLPLLQDRIFKISDN